MDNLSIWIQVEATVNQILSERNGSSLIDNLESKFLRRVDAESQGTILLNIFAQADSGDLITARFWRLICDVLWFIYINHILLLYLRPNQLQLKIVEVLIPDGQVEQRHSVRAW